MSRALVRPAAPEDAQAILELGARVAACGLDVGVPEDVSDEREIEAVIDVLSEDAVKSTLVAAFDGWRGTLFRLAVLPTHRRRGVARALVAKGERSLRERGAMRAAISTGEADPAKLLERVLARTLDTDEFPSAYGVRSVSRFHWVVLSGPGIS